MRETRSPHRRLWLLTIPRVRKTHHRCCCYCCYRRSAHCSVHSLFPQSTLFACFERQPSLPPSMTMTTALKMTEQATTGSTMQFWRLLRLTIATRRFPFEASPIAPRAREYRTFSNSARRRTDTRFRHMHTVHDNKSRATTEERQINIKSSMSLANGRTLASSSFVTSTLTVFSDSSSAKAKVSCAVLSTSASLASRPSLCL